MFFIDVTDRDKNLTVHNWYALLGFFSFNISIIISLIKTNNQWNCDLVALIVSSDAFNFSNLISTKLNCFSTYFS